MKTLILSFILPFTLTAHADLTYSKDIKPIFKNRCSECHDYLADKNWQKYEDAFKHKDTIKQKMLDKSMPMGRDMPQNERDQIVQWVDQGAKE